ncbi:MAG: hypothetical protein WA035_10150, partial [Trichococcus flocculiformis]
IPPSSSNIGRGGVPIQSIWKRIFRLSEENEKILLKEAVFRKNGHVGQRYVLFDCLSGSGIA